MKISVHTSDSGTFAKRSSGLMSSFLDGLLPIFDLGGTLLDDRYVFGNGYEEDIAAIRRD